MTSANASVKRLPLQYPTCFSQLLSPSLAGRLDRIPRPPASPDTLGGYRHTRIDFQVVCPEALGRAHIHIQANLGLLRGLFRFDNFEVLPNRRHG